MLELVGGERGRPEPTPDVRPRGTAPKPTLSQERASMTIHTSALAGATGKGDWTARIENGETIYEHRTGIETSDSDFVERELGTVGGHGQ